MAKMGNTGKRREGGIVDRCVTENISAARPSTEKGITIFRPIPEIAEDGTIRPMINSMIGDEPDFSNCVLENVVINSGSISKFTGLARSDNRHNTTQEEADMVFPGMFIRLRGRQKRGQIPEDLKDDVDALFEGGMKAPLRSAPEMAIMQCVLIRFNDQELKKARPKTALFLTSTAAQDVADCLTRAHKEGIDVFSPDSGYTIILEPEEQRGIQAKFFKASLGKKLPIKADTCRKLWVPWDDGLRYHSHDALMKAAVNAFGRPLVELAFGEAAVATALGEAAPAQRTQVATTEAAPTTTAPAAKEEETAEADDYMQIDTDVPADSLDDDAEEVGDDAMAASSGDDTPASDAGADGDAVATGKSPEEMAAHFEDILGDELGGL